MPVNTGGPIRGFLGRWLMRMQAIQGIVQMVSIEITAASTLSVALQNAGHGQYVPYVFAVAVVGTVLGAYVYVKFGLYNRKNRENNDRGANFASPTMAMDDTTIGVAVFTAINGRQPTPAERAEIEGAVRTQWSEYRDGLPREWFNDN